MKEILKMKKNILSPIGCGDLRDIRICRSYHNLHIIGPKGGFGNCRGIQ
jgi:hypothetical protein